MADALTKEQTRLEGILKELDNTAKRKLILALSDEFDKIRRTASYQGLVIGSGPDETDLRRVSDVFGAIVMLGDITHQADEIISDYEKMAMLYNTRRDTMIEKLVAQNYEKEKLETSITKMPDTETVLNRLNTARNNGGNDRKRIAFL